LFKLKIQDTVKTDGYKKREEYWFSWRV